MAAKVVGFSGKTTLTFLIRIKLICLLRLTSLKLLCSSFIIFFLVVQNSFAQKLQLKLIAKEKQEIIAFYLPKHKLLGDSSELYTKAQQLVYTLIGNGYISASLDSFYIKKDTALATVFVGEQYNWKQLQIAKAIENDVKALNQNFNSINDYLQVPQKLLQFYKNNGYPFAQVYFDSLQIQQGNIKAVLNARKGFIYAIDSIRVLGTAKINNRFLQQYLDIPNGTPYSEKKLQGITTKLQQLPYLSMYKNWDVQLLAKAAIVNLYVEPKKTNRFDAIIGFLPDNSQLQGKLLLTADAKLNLQNAFGGGEYVNILWQQIQPQSPRIELSFEKPYFLKSKFGLTTSFNLYKRDSSFLNVDFRIGASLLQNATTKTSIFFENNSSRIIEPDTISIILNKRLPQNLDVNNSSFGVRFQMQKTNNNLMPTKGFELDIHFVGGIKTIKRNNLITTIKTGNFNYNSLYDSLPNNNYHIRFTTKYNHYFKLNKQAVLKAGINAGIIQTPLLLTNEQFRIGGFKLLRGFDEENIFTNAYAASTLEYRLLFNSSSYFFGFLDAAIANNKLTNITNNFIGSGLGLALQTKQGLLNVSLAFGKRDDLPFNFRENKIHIGLLNNF